MKSTVSIRRCAPCRRCVGGMNLPGRAKIGRGRRWMAAIAGVLLALGLSACVGLPEEAQHSQAEIAQDGAPPVGDAAPAVGKSGESGEISEHGSAKGLSAELLHDLLLAAIAAQRGHNEVAMKSMSRAAYLSRDRRIVAEATALAARLNDHQRVIELARLMAAIDPGDIRSQLALADAQLETGQDEQALNVLIDLARKQPEPGDESLLRSIATLLAKQAPQRILPRFRAAIEAWPENPELKLVAALLALELGEDDAFGELIDQALQLRRDWETAALLKLTHLSDSEPKRMAGFADRFLREFPEAQRFRIQYGRLLLHAKQVKKSLRQLEAALKRDAQSSEALFASALAHWERGDLPKAVARLRKFLQINPQSDQARLHLADIEIELENYDAATAVLHAVHSPRHYLDAQTKLASVIARQSGVEAGIRHLAQIDVRGEAETIRIILEQELLYRDFQLLDRAKEVLDGALERMPGHPDLLYNRGLLAAQLDLLEMHERDMREIIQQQPNHAHAYNALGYTLADQTDRLDEALELITTALELLPDDPYILDSMGWVHFRLGNIDRAIDYLRRALAGKEDAEIAAHLGEALWVAGNRREARKIWKRGREWAPDNATLLDTMKRFSRKNLPDARREVQWELAAAPSSH